MVSNCQIYYDLYSWIYCVGVTSPNKNCGSDHILTPLCCLTSNFWFSICNEVMSGDIRIGIKSHIAIQRMYLKNEIIVMSNIYHIYYYTMSKVVTKYSSVYFWDIKLNSHNNQGKKITIM